MKQFLRDAGIDDDSVWRPGDRRRQSRLRLHLCGAAPVTSNVELNMEERQAIGIPEILIRYSVGIENIEDLLANLDSGLAGI